MNIDCSQNGEYVLLFGGRGYEREVSISGAYRFYAEAEKIKLKFLPIFIDQSGDFYLYEGLPDWMREAVLGMRTDTLTRVHPIKLEGTSGFLKNGTLIPVKLVFPLLHGDFGEDGTVQGLLTSLGINFVGADTLASAVASDKIFAKLVAKSVGVPTLPYIALSKKPRDLTELSARISESFGFPVFVKPARLGSSIGASLVRCEDELKGALDVAFAVAKRIMIEPALLEKRELECAFYSVGDRKIITSPAEISCDSEFYDYDAKYKKLDGVKLTARADVSEETAKRIMDHTDALADALDVRHIARFDYFLLSDGSVFFNEVNTMPGMTDTSLYSAMLSGAGLSFSDFLRQIVGELG